VKNLVIVESPTKARTLSQFLGKDFEITASMGHVRDLPRGEFGVDVEKGFAPIYVIPKEKIKAVNLLVKSSEGAENLFLATDPDREGEAIAWNLLQVISAKASAFAKASEDKKAKSIDYQRVVFHEITKDAIDEAFKNPRKIDDNLVSAQQARRVLDRLVGYKLSPVLWKKVKSKLSAGRVQSVALRLVVDREREIEAFKAEEYWEIEVELQRQRVKETEGQSFVAKLIKIGEEKAQITNKESADKVVGGLQKSVYNILDVKVKDARKYPNPPFTTSTLQQAAANRLGFVPKRTMRAAQNLYEKGLITYMRTDSVNLSPQSIAETRQYIEQKFGKEYLPERERHYRVKSKLAQEAHEAIRPTSIKVTGDSVQAAGDETKLYDLIHKRMLVCQMAEAIVAETTIDVEAKAGPVSSFPPASAQSDQKSNRSGDNQADLRAVGNPSRTATRDFRSYLLRANGQIIKFDGWYKVYAKAPIKEQEVPEVKVGENLDLKNINPIQKFTEPPPRYSEATLIRDLEKHGIGRPSTYAPTISTLYDRFYIERLEARKIGPTPIGTTVVDFLVKYFPNIVDYKFTAAMEEDLDKIAQGEKKLAATMESFWGPFEKRVDEVLETAEKVKVEVEKSDEKCEKCGKDMVVRYGRYGKFLACSGFPDCKNTKALAADTGIVCPDDGGKVVMKRTKKGKPFWGCENWPKCKFASWTRPDQNQTAT